MGTVDYAQLFTPGEAAQELGCAVRDVKRRAERGKFERVVTPEGTMYRRAEVLAAADASTGLRAVDGSEGAPEIPAGASSEVAVLLATIASQREMLKDQREWSKTLQGHVEQLVKTISGPATAMSDGVVKFLGVANARIATLEEQKDAFVRAQEDAKTEETLRQLALNSDKRKDEGLKLLFKVLAPYLTGGDAKQAKAIADFVESLSDEQAKSLTKDQLDRLSKACGEEAANSESPAEGSATSEASARGSATTEEKKS